MSKKLIKIGGPVLALCIAAAVPLIGSATAFADGGTTPPSSTGTNPPPATTDGNPWHG